MIQHDGECFICSRCNYILIKEDRKRGYEPPTCKECYEIILRCQHIRWLENQVFHIPMSPKFHTAHLQLELTRIERDMKGISPKTSTYQKLKAKKEAIIRELNKAK